MTEPPRSRVTADQLRVRLVAEADVPLLATFTWGEADLDDFLRSDALRLQAHRVVRTYLAFHEAVLVGYMALLTDAVVLETKERKRLALGSHDHPIVPALKIARLAAAEGVRTTHAGVGTALVQVALRHRMVWKTNLPGVHRVVETEYGSPLHGANDDRASASSSLRQRHRFANAFA